MKDAFIIDSFRTTRGIGKVGKGAFAHLHPQYLAATTLRAIAERNDLNTAEEGDIISGTSTQKGMQSADLGRMAALDADDDIKGFGRYLGSILWLGYYIDILGRCANYVGNGRLGDFRWYGNDELYRIHCGPECT